MTHRPLETQLRVASLYNRRKVSTSWMMAQASQNLKPIIQTVGELYQGRHVDHHSRENRREMERVIDQLVAASRHADGCSHMSTRVWIQDMDLAAERIDRAGRPRSCIGQLRGRSDMQWRP